MQVHQGLNLVYRIREEQGKDSRIEVVRLYGTDSQLDSQIVQTAYQAYRFHNESELYFKTLEDLGEFALEVCQRSGASEVRILSNTDYNLALDSCHSAKQFPEIFLRYGSIIENPDVGRKKSNIFKKLFN